MTGLVVALVAFVLAVLPTSGPVPVQRLRAVDVDTLPRLTSPLPTVVPDHTDLPSVLADPPGRALMAYHPPEFCDADPGAGWGTETLLLHGADGRWRRLPLAELGLPAAAWPGWDTYGAGSLSPDGHWWAGKSRTGVIVLDLRTGEHSFVDLDTDWVAGVRWRADSRSFVASTHPYRMRAHAHRTHVVAVPSLRQRVGPFERSSHLVAVAGTRFAVVDQSRRLNGEYGRRADLVAAAPGALAPQAVLRFDQVDRPLYRTWWWDADTLLVATDSEVLAWRPDDGTLLRVADLPEAAPGCYATVEVAVGASRRRG